MIGSSSDLTGAGSVWFTNETGGVVEGNIAFASGDDQLEFFPNSIVTGSINGGGGTNSLVLNGIDGSYDELPGALTNFTTLNKRGEGEWVVTGTLTGFIVVTVEEGTLGLTGNNVGYTGTVIVDPGAVLEARAQSLPTLAPNIGNITDNGIVRLLQNDTGTYIGQIIGAGAVEKAGTGTTTLAPQAGANTYSGGTTILGGTLAVASDAVLGAATGPLTLDGGTLLLLSSFDLAATRPLSIGPNNGIIDTQGFDTTVAQGATGAGALTKLGTGTLTFEGVNSYAGGTNVAAGTVVVGDSAHPGAALSGGGPVSVAAGATLGGYGSITGNVFNDGTILVANALADGPAGSFTVNGTLTNSATILVGNGDGFSTLNVNGNLVGDDGVVELHTFLGTDGSPSDLIVLNGGSATGSTGLRIINAGGPGEQTTGDGILVVSAIGGATTDPDAFHLVDEVREGAFDYGLARGPFRAGGASPDSWFLRNSFVVEPEVPTDPIEPGIPEITPPEPGAPEPGAPEPGAPEPEIPEEVLPVDPPPEVLPPGTEWPVIGPEIATYGTVQPEARALGMASLGTLHDRTGDTILMMDGLCPAAGGDTAARDRRACLDGEWRPPVWGRAFGRWFQDRYRSFADPEATGSMAGLQAGIDLLQKGVPGSDRDLAGLYVSYAQADFDVTGLVADLNAREYVNEHTGHVNLSAASLGGYWTHYGPGDWYLDAVVQATRYGGSATTEFTSLPTHGYGLLASLEGGYPIDLPALGPGFRLEPQAQIIWQGTQFDAANDGAGEVSLGASSGVTGRIGVRASWNATTADGTEWRPYLRANLWHDWGDRTETTYGAHDEVPLLHSANRVQLGGGLSVKLNSSLSLNANGDYEFAIGGTDGGKRDGFRAALGLRYSW